MKKLQLEPAFVLHRRSYRESSFLIELFTKNHGRLAVVAKGVRQAKSSTAGLLQPFIPLFISCAGKGELLTLTQAEVNGNVVALRGECLFAGFYLNELLICLLQKWDAHPRLYSIYTETLIALQSNKLAPKILRRFEKCLLEELGYGLLPKSNVSLHNTLAPDKYYRFIPEQGFVVSELGEASQAKETLFSGKSLLAIAKEDWQDEESLQDAKRLTRFILAPLLGTRPLHSRRLFMQIDERNKNEQ